ncbi:ITA2B protein, partial [Pedionomus torquatus]|nr:ITA2B protein [Pedionomus torquatus]
LEAELQLDWLKPKLSRRVLLLQGHQSSWHEPLDLAPGTPPVCRTLTAYLRDEADFKDKLSPVALSLSLALPEGGPGLVLYGDTLVQAQVRGQMAELGTSPVRAWARPHGWARARVGTPSPGYSLPPLRLAPAVPSLAP